MATSFQRYLGTDNMKGETVQGSQCRHWRSRIPATSKCTHFNRPIAFCSNSMFRIADLLNLWCVISDASLQSELCSCMYEHTELQFVMWPCRWLYSCTVLIISRQRFSCFFCVCGCSYIPVSFFTQGKETKGPGYSEKCEGCHSGKSQFKHVLFFSIKNGVWTFPTRL